MKYFGATDFDSIDESDYEGAKIIWDYNNPVPHELHHSYDTFLDFGYSGHNLTFRKALEYSEFV